MRKAVPPVLLLLAAVAGAGGGASQPTGYVLAIERQLETAHSVDVALLAKEYYRVPDVPEDGFNLKLEARFSFAFTPVPPRLVNGNAILEIRQTDRFYQARVFFRDGKMVVADERPPDVPETAFLPARVSWSSFGFSPSLGWPAGISVTAERMPHGGYADFRVLGNPEEIRNLIVYSLESDVLRNWLAFTAPASAVEVGDRWSGHELRFPFRKYGTLVLTPDLELTRVEDGIALITITAREVTLQLPNEPSTEVEFLSGGVHGEVLYGLDCGCVRKLTYQVMLSVLGEYDGGPPVRQKIAFQAEYTPER